VTARAALPERIQLIPAYIFLTKGVGVHKERLSSFELALRDAGIAHFNLVPVSSIFPPGCRIIPRQRGAPMLAPGQIVHCVLAKNETSEPHRLIAAAIGLAIPSAPSRYGYIAEHHSSGQTDEEAGDYAEDLAAQMLATTLGIPFDPNTGYNARKEQYRIGGQIVRTTASTQSAVGAKNGYWTTVIAAAVFL